MFMFFSTSLSYKEGNRYTTFLQKIPRYSLKNSQTVGWMLLKAFIDISCSIKTNKKNSTCMVENSKIAWGTGNFATFPYLGLTDRFNCYSIGFSKNDMHSLTFTRGWAPRPLPISFTSAGAVSIPENVSPIAGIVGCRSNCGVWELHLTIHWVSQPATTNCNCKCVKSMYVHPKMLPESAENATIWAMTFTV